MLSENMMQKLKNLMFSSPKEAVFVENSMSKAKIRNHPFNHFQVLPKYDPDYHHCTEYVYEPLPDDFASRLQTRCEKLFEKNLNKKAAYQNKKGMISKKLKDISEKFKNTLSNFKIQRMPVAIMLKMLAKVLKKWNIEEYDDAELTVMAVFSLAHKYHLDKDETYLLKDLLETFEVEQKVDVLADYERSAFDAMEYTFTSEEYHEAIIDYNELFPGCLEFNERCFNPHHKMGEVLTEEIDGPPKSTESILDGFGGSNMMLSTFENFKNFMTSEKVRNALNIERLQGAFNRIKLKF